MPQKNELDIEILDYVGDNQDRDVPLFEIILKFKSGPYGHSKAEIMDSVRRLDGNLLIKSYIPVKCRLVPAYRLKYKNDEDSRRA